MTASGTISIDGNRALARGDAILPRLTSLLRSATDGSKTAVGTWSVADVGAHLALLFELYPSMIRGQPSPVTNLDDVGAASAAFLEAYPDRDLTVLAEKLEAAWDVYASTVREVGPDNTMIWHGGI